MQVISSDLVSRLRIKFQHYSRVFTLSKKMSTCYPDNDMFGCDTCFVPLSIQLLQKDDKSLLDSSVPHPYIV